MRKILGTLLVGMMLSVGGSIMRAGPLEDATGASERGDYATALGLLRPLAESAHAQHGADGCSISPERVSGQKVQKMSLGLPWRSATIRLSARKVVPILYSAEARRNFA
jgi:hypothetical protein